MADAMNTPITLIARAAGFGPARAEVGNKSDDSEEIVIYLDEEARLEIIDLDEFGAPRAGGHLTVRDGAGVSQRAVTDESGVAQFANLAPGRLQIHEEDRAFLPGVRVVSGHGDTDVVLTPGEFKRVTLGEPGVVVSLIANPPRSAGIRVQNEDGVGRVVLLGADGQADLVLRARTKWMIYCSTGTALVPLREIEPSEAGGSFTINLPDQCPEGSSHRVGSD